MAKGMTPEQKERAKDVVYSAIGGAGLGSIAAPYLTGQLRTAGRGALAGSLLGAASHAYAASKRHADRERALRESIVKKAAASGVHPIKGLKKSHGWGEGEHIRIEGMDKEIRQKLDNSREGYRYDPRYHNQFIRMKER